MIPRTLVCKVWCGILDWKGLQENANNLLCLFQLKCNSATKQTIMNAVVGTYQNQSVTILIFQFFPYYPSHPLKTYHSSQNQPVIPSKTPRNSQASITSDPDDDAHERVEDTCDDNICWAGGDWILIVWSGPGEDHRGGRHLHFVWFLALGAGFQGALDNAVM